MATNEQIIRKANEILATGQTSGMMNPEQAKKFMLDAKESSDFMKLMRMEGRKATKGTIEKLGIGRRLLRPKVEATDGITGNGITPTLGSVPYSTVDMTLGWELSNKFLRENIEQRGFIGTFMAEIAKQTGVDLLDLCFNGDKATAVDDPDYLFLTLIDGYIKQLQTGSNIVDAATINNGIFSPEYFIKAAKVLPKQYSTNGYNWISNKNTYLTWLQYMQGRSTAAGDAALLGSSAMDPLGNRWQFIPNFPEDNIIFANPSNFTLVYTYDIQTRTTIEGKEALYKDMMYGATFLDADAIIMEKNAVVMLTNVSQVLAA